MTSDEIVSITINNQVKELVNGKDNAITDIKDRLPRLAKLVQIDGVEEEDLDSLLELVIATPKYLSSSEKTYIIKNCLIPNRNYYLKDSILHRILSQITTPQTYYKNGTKYKLKSLSQNLQLLLLEWLLGSLYLFKDVFSTLNNYLPILLGLLSLEYLRPYVANLIFLAVLKNSTNVKTYYNKQINNIIKPFKNWHVEMVANLYAKFPLDPYLKSLLILFKTIDPNYNFSRLESLQEIGFTIDDNPQIFKFPTVQAIPSKTLTFEPEFSSNLKRTKDIYDDFEIVIRKKRRLNSNNLDLIPESNVSIDKINSIKELAQNFQNISPFTFNTLFDVTNPHQSIRFYYVLLQILAGNDSYVHKLDYMIDFVNLNQDNNFKLDSQMLYAISGLPLPMIQKAIFSGSLVLQDYDEYHHKILSRIQLLPLVNLVTFTDYDERFFNPIMKLFQERHLKARDVSKHHQLISLFVENQLFLFQKWYRNIEQSVAQENIFIIINTSILKMYKFLQTIPGLPVQDLLLLKILDFMKSISLDHLNRFFEDHTVMIPPSLMSKMFLNLDPFISSEICDYMVHCKAYTFKDRNMKTNYQNFVKDMINFIWLDNAFGNNNDRKSFYMYPNLVDRLSQLPIYNYSQVLTFKGTGSIFHNPGWSYIGAQIIWRLEDEHENITIRHQGPITQDSVSNMNSQETGTWLDMGFDDIKVNVLKRLQELDFNGLSKLLFSSLKSLANRRDV